MRREALGVRLGHDDGRTEEEGQRRRRQRERKPGAAEGS